MENQTVESPDFDRIKTESGTATRDAIQLLWYVANNESAERRRGVRAAKEQSIRKIKELVQTAQIDNYDTDGCGIVKLTGTASVDFTGIRNGVEGELKVIHHLGSGTVTHKHESASSDASNRFDTAADADVTQAAGETMLYRYVNSRWRQQVQAT